MNEPIQPTTLKDYYEANVLSCRDCSYDDDICGFITDSKLLPFSGKPKGSVLILGHSPSVRTNSIITMTLDLNNESTLWRYIVCELLSPMGIDLNRCAATNIVKCHTSVMPEDIIIQGRHDFVERAFKYCRKHLENEIYIYEPKLIISLSERVARILQKTFRPDIKVSGMKEIFGTSQNLLIRKKNYCWIPVVHIPKGKVRDAYFPEQTNRLKRLRREIDSVL